MKKALLVLVSVVLAAGIIGGATYKGLADKKPVVVGAAANIKIDKNETDPEAFKAAYPAHFDSYLKNRENNPAALKYNNSLVKKSKLDEYPYMRTLWNGFAFAKEYNEARGHAYTLADTIGETKTARISDKTPLTCMYCKSPEVPALVEKMGDAFFNTKLLEGDNKAMFKHPIGCSDCHNPETMELRISRPALVEAFQRQGKDINKATRQEMRTLVCAQCHVTYFFNDKDKNKLYFPWDNGIEPNQMYQYETDLGFSDWKHAQTGGGMLKARHPEYETFQGSVHQQAGLSCADCHMPYMKQGSAKISSHWWTSPMRTYQQSCGTCHKQSEKEMAANVLYIQDRTKATLDRAGEANKAAVAAIEKALKTEGADQKKIDEARALHREGQFYWDLVGAENSMGFHNPPKVMKTLADSIDLGRQAEVKALEAIAGAKK